MASYREVMVVPVGSGHDLEQIRLLFAEYAASLGFDLDFQDFDEEMAGLPGDYAPPTGCMFLARRDTEAVGCVALRKLTPTVCEMKRLYVQPSHRGKGLGRALSRMVIVEARRIGYTAMRLDTLASMTRARELYRSMGFKEIEPYRFNPIQEAVFMELWL